VKRGTSPWAGSPAPRARTCVTSASPRDAAAMPYRHGPLDHAEEPGQRPVVLLVVLPTGSRARIGEGEGVEQHRPLQRALLTPQRMPANDVVRAGRSDSSGFPPPDNGPVGVLGEDRGVLRRSTRAAAARAAALRTTAASNSTSRTRHDHWSAPARRRALRRPDDARQPGGTVLTVPKRYPTSGPEAPSRSTILLRGYPRDR
jgi:hypothetical protein